MALSDVALLAVDPDFLSRTSACVAVEQNADPGSWVDINPQRWAMEHQWQMAATPTFGDKYGYAVSTGVVRPGNDPSVISDGEILSAVQAIDPDLAQPAQESPQGS
jgi:hypothetical protein